MSDRARGVSTRPQSPHLGEPGTSSRLSDRTPQRAVRAPRRGSTSVGSSAGSEKESFVSFPPEPCVVGYVRVSTDIQAASGAGLEAQRTSIRDECLRRGWRLLSICEDAAASAKTMRKRPGLANALHIVESGQASALVVAKLDRLSRSMLDFIGLMERSRSKGWAVVALDAGFDTMTPSGEVMASVLAAFGQYERRLVGIRTKEALAVKRLQGIRLGRPRAVPDAVVHEVRRARARGASFAAIATRLNHARVPTGHHAASWQAASVRWLLRSRKRDAGDRSTILRKTVEGQARR